MIVTERRHLQRQKALATLGILFAAAIVVKLVSLQYIARDRYTAQATTQHVKETSVAASRGRILDRNERVLATTLEGQSFFLNNISDSDTLKAIAVRFSRRTGEDEQEVLRRLKGKRSFVWLARQVVGGPDFDDIPNEVGRVVEMVRTYPLGPVAGQLIGYTDVDNVGIEGIERHFDAELRGTAGEIQSRVDARGRVVGGYGVMKQLPEDGGDLTLTIDADFQSIVEEELSATVDSFDAVAGVAVMLDPGTGEILAMATVPLYDPNSFSKFPPQQRRNRAVTDLFEPGSTFKIVAIAGALEDRAISDGDSVFGENGRLEVAGDVIRDTHPMQWMSVADIIEESSNVGTIKVARRLGPAGLYRYTRLFGFGGAIASDLPGEVDGDVRHPSRWSGRSLETISIGQEVSATALQVATSYAVVANGGLLVRPHIRRATSGARTDTVRRVISEKTAATVRRYLEGVVSHGTGTNAAVPGYRVAGKTGTAQRAYDDRPGYDPDRYVSSFAGFLPADDPELLCLVVVDSPVGTHLGSQVAAPVFSKIMKRVVSLRDTRIRHRAARYATRRPEDKSRAREMPALEGLNARQTARTLARTGISGREALNAITTGRKSVAVLASAEQYERPANAIPDVVGVPLRQAVAQLTKAGFRVKATGSGVVVRQVPASGAAAQPGSVARVVCSQNG